MLWVECASIGSARLGFKPNEMGTHSLQSVAATEMYLASVLVCTIMLIGWWSSDAFLRYIQKQVEQFSKNISKQLIKFKSFRTIPDIAPRVVLIKNPRQRNHQDSAKTWNNIGCNRSFWVQLPAFAHFNLQAIDAEEQSMERRHQPNAKGVGGGES